MHDAPPGDMFGAVVAKSAWHAVGDRLGSMLAWVNKTYSTGQLTLSSADWRAEPNVSSICCRIPAISSASWIVIAGWWVSLLPPQCRRWHETPSVRL